MFDDTHLLEILYFKEISCSMALVSTVSFLSVIGEIGVGFQLNNFP